MKIETKTELFDICFKQNQTTEKMQLIDKYNCKVYIDFGEDTTRDMLRQEAEIIIDFLKEIIDEIDHGRL